MALDVAKFQAPLAGANPCGDSLAADGAVQALHTLAAGKEGSQFAEGEPADWRQVRARSEELLKRSKHLDVALPYTVALLEQEGLPGLAAGLELIAGFVGSQWEHVHPELDPNDPDLANDPQQRISILENLSVPVGTFGDRWQVLARLRRTTLTPADDALHIGTILAAKGGAALPDLPVLDAGGVVAAIGAMSASERAEATAALDAALQHLEAIRTTFREKAAEGRAPDFRELVSDLTRVRATLNDGTVVDGEEKGAAPAGTRVASAPPRSGGTGIPGEIDTPEQVIAAIDQICRYYERHQPASPLPLLLQRVRRLAKANFLSIVEDLMPNALSEFKSAAGVKDPPAPSA